MMKLDVYEKWNYFSYNTDNSSHMRIYSSEFFLHYKIMIYFHRKRERESFFNIVLRKKRRFIKPFYINHLRQNYTLILLQRGQL